MAEGREHAVPTSRGQGLTRRRLLAGAATSAAVGAAGPARALGLTDTWFDVIVVGAGGAGMAAAHGARRADPQASITVLEAKPTHGGTSFRSGGRLWVPNNSDMRRAGLRDPRRAALKYMARLAYPRRYDAEHPRLGLNRRHFRQLGAYYDRGAEIFDYYRDQGILDWEAERWLLFPWNKDPVNLTGQHSPDYHPELRENVPKRGRTVLTKHFDPTLVTAGVGALPIPNFGASLAGIDMAQWLFFSALRRNIGFQPATRAVDLITTRTRKGLVVTGVEVITMIDDLAIPIRRRIHARRGVILASGGFSKSQRKLERRFRGRKAFTGGGCGVTSAQGDAVDMARRHGIKLEHMGKAWLIENVYEQYMLDPDSRSQVNYLMFQAYWLNGDSMIVVNRRGRRVYNEKLNYNDRTAVHHRPQNRFLISVFDQHTFDHFIVGLGGHITPAVQTLIGPASTTEELRRKLLQRFDRYPALSDFGLARDFRSELDSTIRRFNGFARRGVDKDFKRGRTEVDIWWHAFALYFLNVDIPGVGTVIRDAISANVDERGVPYPNITMRPLEPPFYAVILASGLQDTKGGPAIDERARILDRDERPVAGLYGAGNAIASPAGSAYWGAGGTLGPAVVFGHIAGENAAKRR